MFCPIGCNCPMGCNCSAVPKAVHCPTVVKTRTVWPTSCSPIWPWPSSPPARSSPGPTGPTAACGWTPWWTPTPAGPPTLSGDSVPQFFRSGPRRGFRPPAGRRCPSRRRSPQRGYRAASAVTHKGPLTLWSTVEAQAGRVYELADSSGLAHHLLNPILTAGLAACSGPGTRRRRFEAAPSGAGGRGGRRSRSGLCNGPPRRGSGVRLRGGWCH